MNAIARLTPALLIAAAVAGAVVMAQAPRETLPRNDADIVVLPTVQVIGQRAAATEIVQLPTVTVIAKRPASAATLVAQKATSSDAL